MPLSPLHDILADLRAGKMVILTDDENRENEGDLILPAQFVTPEAITFMLSVARGYMCLSLTEADCDRLDLHPQSSANTSARGTPFTVSIDGHPRHGFTTGVSARERARSIQIAIDPASRPEDFVRPGHINPLRSRDGGVLVRTGQTEGSIDLCRLAGLHPSAVIIEIMRDDGEMARLPDLEVLAAKHNLKIGSVAQIIQHRLEHGGVTLPGDGLTSDGVTAASQAPTAAAPTTLGPLIRRIDPVDGSPLHTSFGDFTLFAFESLVDPLPHVALTVGGIGALDPLTRAVTPHPEPTLVRMHRRHLLGDIFLDTHSAPDGPTADSLHAAMRALQSAGRGVLVYLRSEGRTPPDRLGGPSDALENRLQTIRGHATPPEIEEYRRALAASNPHTPAAMRDYGIGVQVLRALGLQRIRLLTNRHTELPNLDAFGLQIVERVPFATRAQIPR